MPIIEENLPITGAIYRSDLFLGCKKEEYHKEAQYIQEGTSILYRFSDSMGVFGLEYWSLSGYWKSSSYNSENLGNAKFLKIVDSLWG